MLKRPKVIESDITYRVYSKKSQKEVKMSLPFSVATIFLVYVIYAYHQFCKYTQYAYFLEQNIFIIN